MRLSIPFIGGPTVVLDKEEYSKVKTDVINKVNAIKDLTKDKAFQDALLKATGYTLAYALFAFGVLTVWKWWVGYKAFVILGGSVKAATALKVAAVGGTSVAGIIMFRRNIKGFLDAREAELKAQTT